MLSVDIECCKPNGAGEFIRQPKFLGTEFINCVDICASIRIVMRDSIILGHLRRQQTSVASSRRLVTSTVAMADDGDVAYTQRLG